VALRASLTERFRILTRVYERCLQGEFYSQADGLDDGVDAEGARQRVGDARHVGDRHPPKLTTSPVAAVQVVQAMSQVEKIGEGEACPRRQLPILSAPTPPLAITLEPEPLPDFYAHGSEDDGAVTRRTWSITAAMPVPMSGQLADDSGGLVSGHNPIDFRVAAGAHLELVAEDVDRSAE